MIVFPHKFLFHYYYYL